MSPVRRALMEKDNFMDEDAWWFWMLFPITIPLWIFGAILDAIGIT
jgi:hypothetical protein